MERNISKRHTTASTRAHLSAARRELCAIVRATEAAAGAIMQCAENVLSADPACAESYRRIVGQQMSAIFESCAFQDITGQRIARIIAQLTKLELQLAHASLRLAEERKDDGSARKRGPLLHGPQPQGRGNSQAEIDALFLASEAPSR
jgi:chemotaxis protein CheZ